MLPSRNEIKALTDQRLAASQADHCVVHVNASDTVNLRFACNSATSNGVKHKLSVTIVSHFGQRSGSATVTGFDAERLEQVQRQSEAIAREAPADPEWMPPLGPQDYPEGIAFDGPTAELPSERLAAAAKTAIGKARARSVDATGFCEAGARLRALATSAGLFACDRDSLADFTVTARRPDGSWSGWSGGSKHRFDALDPDEISGRAVEKAAHEQPPLDLEPGRYRVILEPAAVGEMLRYLQWSMDARMADEGRSWLSAKGGGTKLGDQLLESRVTIHSDPADAQAPSAMFGSEGLPQERTVWVENGVVRHLACSRYWATKSGREPRPAPGGLIMAGGPTPLEEMIRATQRGILVTRVWYTNMLDPQTLLLTGLTRDGNFLIENGRISGPVRNFRFNESLIAMLSNIDAIGPSERIHGGDLRGAPVAAPPLLVNAFTFSSRSSGI